VQPVLQLEGQRGKARRDRVARILGSHRGAAMAMQGAFATAESVLALGLAAADSLAHAADDRSSWFAMWLSGDGEWMTAAGLACFALAVAIVEPFFVGAGFAMYLNRARRARGLGHRAGVPTCLRALNAARVARAGARPALRRLRPPRRRDRRSPSSPAAALTIAAAPSASEPADARRAGERAGARALERGGRRGAASAVRADPDLGGVRKERTWRFRKNDNERDRPVPPPLWLRELAGWLAEGGRGSSGCSLPPRSRSSSSPPGAGWRCTARRGQARRAPAQPCARARHPPGKACPPTSARRCASSGSPASGAPRSRCSIAAPCRGSSTRTRSRSATRAPKATASASRAPRCRRRAATSSRPRRRPGSSPSTASRPLATEHVLGLCADFDRLLPPSRRPRPRADAAGDEPHRLARQRADDALRALRSIAWFMRAVEWVDVDVPTLPKGEAARDRFYVAKQLVRSSAAP
jgi:hypothetical protein